MKNKKLFGKKDDYSQFKAKLCFKIMGSALLAVVISMFLYVIWSMGAIEIITAFLTFVPGVSYEKAIYLCNEVIYGNQTIIWMIVIGGIFMLFLRRIVNGVVEYFDLVNKGIDKVMDENPEIELPPEMAVTERRLRATADEYSRRRIEAGQAEQRKNDLVMYLAHDIRTPLTSVIGYLSLLSEAPDMPAEQRAKYIGITLDKANRLEKMINEFFEITRYNLQSINIIKEKTDLYYMMIQLADELLPIMAEKGNKTVIDISEDLVVYGDPEKLARVFNNVLKNAAAYSYADTDIRIEANQQDGFIIIDFINKGNNIPQQKLDSIFEKFYRLDESRTSNTGGAGLGLAIAKEIVTLHGGTIKAKSENETVTFTISLPEAP